MIIDFSSLAPRQAYHLITQSVVPRPIAWVLTGNEAIDEHDPYNLAPFSYFNAVASDPPILMLSISPRPDGSHKDTLINIQRSGKLVIHIASADNIEALNQSSASLPYGQSELRDALVTMPLDHFELPRLADARIAFACELEHLQEIGNAPQTLVFARINRAFYSDEIAHIDEQKGRIHIDAAGLDPLSRLGGSDYAILGKHITRKRPA